ncbi:hypothetical protein B0H11DRAFT_620916 [Mycena galericulata]|nr:hypothetical protein B0H11DRAFT_620916 [Mycena galericulata]
MHAKSHSWTIRMLLPKRLLLARAHLRLPPRAPRLPSRLRRRHPPVHRHRRLRNLRIQSLRARLFTALRGCLLCLVWQRPSTFRNSFTIFSDKISYIICNMYPSVGQNCSPCMFSIL